MAVDSKNKRMSMISYCMPLAWGHHFPVDGTIHLADRKHLLHLYAGQLIGDVPFISIDPVRIVRHTGRYV